MSKVDEQIRKRIEKDEQNYSRSFIAMATAITGEKVVMTLYERMKDYFEAVCRFYHINKEIKIPTHIESYYGRLDYMCSNSGLAYREIKLTKGWYKDSVGVIVALRKDTHIPAILIPNWRGYKFLYEGKYHQINSRNQNLFETQALVFYHGFPDTELKVSSLLKYAFYAVPIRSYVIIILLMLVSTLLGLISPKLSYFLYGPVIEYSSTTLLSTTILFMICLSISTLLFSTFQSMYSSLVTKNLTLQVEAASMQRMFSIQPSFFRKYTAGEMSTRLGYITSLTTSIFNLIFSTTLSSLFSLAYISSIFQYAPELVAPALIIIAVTIIYSLIVTFAQMKISKKKMVIDAKESGLTYSIISGIQKVRLAGAEKRMFAKWADVYSQQCRLSYSPPAYLKYNSMITLIISLAGNFVMYYCAIKSGVSVAEYSAFSSAYGMVFGAFSSLASIAISIANIKPNYDLAKPIMKAPVEKREGKETVSSLTGSIDVSNVSFRYNDSMPFIYENFNLHIKAGEYVAIVGKTGVGKSTLVRLLLGFENPQKGAIYYDGKDIVSLNLKSLRRNIGTVMQDGKLFSGDIFSNIAVCAPELTLEGAFEAADMAGVGNDIREMPMGMFTVISDGGGGISGGQKQRIMIARAVAPKPKILIFDEATSALDNITQRQVSEALDNLKCTRLIIAHRLSTIKQCDRIIFLENGAIKEDGTYDELIKLNGSFADLVKHQMIENE